ncbi:MAG: hypothetical protein COB02_04525 [Candidatus Cloacimonadota bacterium]|nr:MAG: hypothetical protein COB02_04525 [Candidatus Cloacimonadota bacterium]
MINSFDDLNLVLKKRGNSRKKGVFTFIVASLVLLDSPFYFPIPLVGFFSVVMASFIYLMSFFQIYNGIKLPKKEFLSFIFLNKNTIKKEEVFTFFKDEIDDSSYEKMVNQLEKLDFISLPNHDMEYVESHSVIPENQLNLTDKGLDFLKKGKL